MRKFENIKNWQLKLLAILTAMLLWLFVAGTENYVFTLNESVPVQVIHLASDLSLANKLSDVTVKYTSVNGQIKNLGASEFEAAINAKNLREGHHTVKVTVTSINPQISVIAAEPAQMDINLEAIITKEIDTKLIVKGNPAQNYQVTKATLSIPKITIKGAQSVLQSINQIKFTINLDGTEKADFSRMLAPVSESDWNVANDAISFKPNKVQANLQIRKLENANIIDNAGMPNQQVNHVMKKTLMAKVIIPNNMKTAIKEVLPTNLLVTVEGQENIVNNLKNTDITVYLNMNRLEKGGIFTVKKSDFQFDPKLQINVVDFSPAQIRIKF